MSELLLYILATAVVLAGVAYFFVKQREQELSASRDTKRNRKGGKKEAKAKEAKEPKEQREAKPRKPRARKEKEEKEEKEAAPLSKKQLKAAAKEEDETKGVLDFLKGKKFSSDKAGEKAQIKVRTAAPEQRKEPAKAKAPAQVESESETDSDEEQTDYVTIKRKQQTKPVAKETPKSAEEEDAAPPTEEKKPRKKTPKFFSAAEKAQYEADQLKAKEDYLARKAEREERKNRPPGEKRERKPRKPQTEGAEGEEGADGFKPAVRERRPRRERKEGEEGEEGERKSKYPPREPDVAPPFETEYQTADMDSILNSLTSYYRSNPEANFSRPAKRNQPKAEAEVEAEDDKE